MTKSLLLINGIITLVFGIVVLLVPGPVFEEYAIALDAGAMLIARGYAAALIGYGLVFVALRSTADTAVVKALLFAATVFNAIEAAIQAAAGAAGIVTPLVWITVGVHAVLAFLCAIMMVRSKAI